MPRLPALPFVEEPAVLHPVLGVPLGAYAQRILGVPGGLAQFGAHIERLPPGSTSSLRHWQETEDDFVLMLSVASDAAVWPAGMPNGHCLENRADADATYLTIGTRNRADAIHCPTTTTSATRLAPRAAGHAAMARRWRGE